MARTPGSRNKRKSATVRRALLTAIRQGNTLATSAAVAGITYDTLKRWRRLDPLFNTAVAQAEAKAEVKHVGNISLAGVGSWQASAWWLERRRSADWRKPPERLEVSDARKEAEAIAAEIGKPELVDAIERDILISIEARP